MQERGRVKKYRIISQIVFSGDFLHFSKRKTFGAIMKKAGLFSPYNVLTVSGRKLYSSACNRQRMCKTIRIQRFKQLTDPCAGMIKT